MFHIKINLVLKTENQQNMQYLAYLQTKQSIEKNEKTSCIFLDFAKAFHTVKHAILLLKLEHYGTRGPLNTDSNQTLVIENRH